MLIRYGLIPAELADQAEGSDLPVPLEEVVLTESSPSVTTSDAAQTPEERQLEALLELRFDRRPASVLAALAQTVESARDATNAVERFHLDVVAGNWPEVGRFMGELPEDQRAPVYDHLLQGLLANPSTLGGGGTGPPNLTPGMVPPGAGGLPPNLRPGQTVLPDDVLALADIAPVELTEAQMRNLGRLLSNALSQGAFIQPVLERLEAGTRRLGGREPAKRRLALDLLVAANRLTDAKAFLPPLPTDGEEMDLVLMDLHARCVLAAGRRDNDEGALRKAWELNNTLLTARQASPSAKGPTQEALLRRALTLLPGIGGPDGTNWLRGSFRDRPAQGMALLAAAVATQGGQGNARQAAPRLESLKLQSKVVRALLEVSESPAASWAAPLNVLALNWIREADICRQYFISEQRPQPNPYGYIDPYQQMEYDRQRQNANRIQAIAPEELLELVPGPRWLAMIERSQVPRVRVLTARLWFKAGDELRALPSLAQLAPEFGDQALPLANELLGSWSRTHDPSGSRSRGPAYGPYGVVWYGVGSPYGTRGGGVSLTRAKQERNLKELASILDEVRSLGLPPLDPDVVVRAFTAAHSTAEVFRREAILEVFGPIEAMRVETLAGLASVMRERLSSQWRSARVQREEKTKRSDTEIQAEVLRGYRVVTGLVEEGLARWPDHWRLRLVQAAAWFDLAEFQYGRKVDLAIYVEERERAFAAFERTASLYAADLATADGPEPTALPFVQWFNANLGASDLAYVTRQQEPSRGQLEKIRAAILALPDGQAERHLELFGEQLSGSVRSIKPELKPRYVRAGLVVAGDTPSTRSISELAAYYDELLGEIQLQLRLDGNSSVGHSEPFGVFISLRHSVEIERESGGFGRYLQSQSSRSGYYSPYGQSPSNRRDDFETQLREKLAEAFEIKVITFADPKVQSRGYGRLGWRETPVAYLLLQAKDGAADRLPSLQFDLDFSDRNGQVVLPVASPVVLIDARPSRGAPRPFAGVEITQVLDDRALSESVLTLDIQAKGRGLLPSLDRLLRMDVPGFEVIKTEEQGLAVTQLDTEGNDLAALSERNWLLRLAPARGTGGAARFRFPEPLTEDIEMTCKRYEDADLVEVRPELALAGIPVGRDPSGLWFLLFVVVAGGATVVYFRKQGRLRREPAEAAAYDVPTTATPFNVLSLLRRMEADSGLPLSPDHRTRLTHTIRELEQDYFAVPTDGEPREDLDAVAREWVETTRPVGKPVRHE